MSPCFQARTEYATWHRAQASQRTKRRELRGYHPQECTDGPSKGQTDPREQGCGLARLTVFAC